MRENRVLMFDLSSSKDHKIGVNLEIRKWIVYETSSDINKFEYSSGCSQKSARGHVSCLPPKPKVDQPLSQMKANKHTGIVFQ